jgi:probable rRNA maturation factor
LRKADPSIEILVGAGDWPPEAELRDIAERAVAAAVAALEAAPGGSALPSPPKWLAPGTELSILFTDDAAIRKLNAEWRGKDRPTNVLSFPQASGPLLGDVILAAETVRDEAALARKPIEDHMAHLIVHGFLHVIGYDHEADEEAEAMEAVEREALKRMGIADPYAPARDR